MFEDPCSPQRTTKWKTPLILGSKMNLTAQLRESTRQPSSAPSAQSPGPQFGNRRTVGCTNLSLATFSSLAAAVSKPKTYVHPQIPTPKRSTSGHDSREPSSTGKAKGQCTQLVIKQSCLHLKEAVLMTPWSKPRRVLLGRGASCSGAWPSCGLWPRSNGYPMEPNERPGSHPNRTSPLPDLLRITFGDCSYLIRNERPKWQERACWKPSLDVCCNSNLAKEKRAA